jgi:hypothetical protein
MEQQLNATYLSPEPIERAAAIGIGAVAIGIGIFLAAWGISFLWRYTPPEIVVRIANPELNVVQSAPFAVTQDKPFALAQPDPLKIEKGQLTIKTEAPEVTSGVGANRRTPTGEVIRREVTVFSNVKHGPGTIVTGWIYPDGGGSVPVRQYCYYAASNVDQSSTRVDIAFNGARASHISALLVPDLEGALARCQWWQG